MSIVDRLIAQVKQWVNYTEIRPNMGFTNPAFDKLMRANSPFENGFAWCACTFCCLWNVVYAEWPDLLAELKKLFSANSQQLLRNFKASRFKTSTTTPILGAAVVFGDVGSSVSGHTAACIIDINPDGIHYTSVEGNVNDKVSIVNHVVGAPHPVTGLEFLGFIYPVEPPESVAAPDNTAQQQIVAPAADNSAHVRGITPIDQPVPDQPSKLNQILILFKNYHMNFTGSWRTSLFGGLAVLPQILPILFPKTFTFQMATAMSILFGGIGLGAAKDGQVTGGTIANPSNDASVVCNNTTVDAGLQNKTS